MTVLIDDREKVPPPALTASWLEKRKIPAEVTRLDAADFQFFDANGGLVMVTRKATDLFDSMYSKHLNDELRACIGAVKAYGKGSVWFMLDGIYVGTHSGNIGVYTSTGQSEWLRLKNERVGDPQLITSLQASLQAVNVNFISTTFPPAALKVLWERAQKVDEEGQWPSSFMRGTARPDMKWHSKSTPVAHLCTLWPRLNERAAAEMISKFGSIAKVVELAGTDDGIKQLLAIDKVGKKGIENFRGIVL